MKTISELTKQLSSLPSGNIYKKKINGHIYYYHHYFLDGKRYSRIVSSKQLPVLEKQLEERKKIEKQIKVIRSKQKTLTLSKAANELTGYIMSGNKVVASFEKGEMNYIDENLAPLVICRTHSIEQFLKLRIIDMSRTNARILKRVLNIHVDEDYKAALYSYALSISDNYWFKPKHSKIKYNNIVFQDDSFYDVSLKGDVSFSSFKNHLTPEITTLGSFEKGWRYINNEWWLYKSGTDKQIYSELLAYQFAKLINLDTAVYQYDNGYIRSKNFAKTHNFEPLAALLGDNDDYNVIFNKLYMISEDIAKQYLKLSFFDCVIYNVDRHNENIGLMRDKSNGKIVSLSPNFDNNLSFYSSNIVELKRPERDGLINLFLNFLKSNKKALELYQEIDFKDINEEDINNCLSSIEFKTTISPTLKQNLLDRYYWLKDYFNKQHI